MSILKFNRFWVNYSLSDYISSTYFLASKKSVQCSMFEKFFNTKSLFYVNSGRTALYTILKGLGLKKGSGVGVQPYLCPEIFNSIVLAGFKPIFVDINLNDYTLDVEDLQKKKAQISALVVVHTFGNAADIDKIRSITQEIPIIEDCAHALLTTYKGRNVGKFGVASFYSFRLRKFLSAGEGGIIVLNHAKYKKSLAEIIQGYPKSGRLEEFSHSFKVFLLALLNKNPLFSFFTLPVWSILASRKLDVDLAREGGFKIRRIREVDKHVISRKLGFINEYIHTQRKLATFLKNQLKGKKNIYLSSHCIDSEPNFSFFPIRTANSHIRDFLRALLLKQGFDSSAIWSKSISEAKRYGYKGGCPNSEMAAETVLLLPIYPSMKREYLLRMVKDLDKVIG